MCQDRPGRRPKVSLFEPLGPKVPKDRPKKRPGDEKDTKKDTETDPQIQFFVYLFWGLFLEPFFTQLLAHLCVYFSGLVLMLFALWRDLAQAAFLRDVPSEMQVFWRQSVHETLRKPVSKDV